MKRIAVWFFIPMILWGCSAPVVAERSEHQVINIANLASLGPGRDDQNTIRGKFGSPQQTLSRAEIGEIWIYSVETHEGSQPRATLVFDSSSKRLLSSTWIPSVGDSVNNLESARAHFKSANFILVPESPPISHHFRSNELTYEDLKTGISIQVRKTTHGLMAISFGPRGAGTLTKRN
jgi:hypothetical protein